MNVISAPTQLSTMAQSAFIKEEFTTKHRIFSVTNVKRALTKSQTMLNIYLNNTILFININSQIQYWLNGSIFPNKILYLFHNHVWWQTLFFFSQILMELNDISRNPWAVETLDVYLHYCCPECDHKRYPSYIT